VHAQLSLPTLGCGWLHSYCQWVAILVQPFREFGVSRVISTCWPIQRALFMQAQNWPQSCRSARPEAPKMMPNEAIGRTLCCFASIGTTNSSFFLIRKTFQI
jgi:hypothetical protein